MLRVAAEVEPLARDDQERVAVGGGEGLEVSAAPVARVECDLGAGLGCESARDARKAGRGLRGAVSCFVSDLALRSASHYVRDVVLDPLTHFDLREGQSTAVADRELEYIDEILAMIELNHQFGRVLTRGVLPHNELWL
jgi:hypothetical protein